MSLVIDLPTIVEARVESEARHAGVSPEEYVQNLVARAVASTDSMLDAKLRKWQEQDGKVLRPDRSAKSLFAQWDSLTQTDAEREAEDRLWREVLQGMNEVRSEQSMRVL
jgi:hypothetical protein